MALASLKKLRRRLPTEPDIAGLFREIREERNDRGAVLLACNFLDNCLKFAIYQVLPDKPAAQKLFEDRAPLYSFSAKIATAHALGLYGSQTRRNLDILREIRNIFAREMTGLSLETSEIAEACGQLVLPDPHPTFPKTGFKFDKPRERYVSAALAIGATVSMNAFGTFYEGKPDEIRPTRLP